MHWLRLVPVLVLVLLSQALAQTQPYQPRVGPNLVANPTLSGTSNWTILNGASYDASTSRTADGSGSVLMPIGGRVDSQAFIPVTAGKTYMLEAYITSAGWPAGQVYLIATFYNSAGAYIGFGQSGPAHNSRPDTWEEIALVITPDSSISYITVDVQRIFGQAGSGSMWVDEFYFGENIGFGSPPSAKLPFNGADVTVDALGNMQVKKGGVFQNFFPLCIYSDAARTNAWQLYSNQGFNCDMWGDHNTTVAAANATSAFNPDGMMSGIQVVQYMTPLGFAWDAGGVNLTNLITALKGTGKFDSHVLLYYYDNENMPEYWTEPMNMIDVLKANDRTGGVRSHPLYILQGSPNAARAFRKLSGEVATDMTGTYSDAAGTGGQGQGGAQDILQNEMNQQTPVVIAQMNIGGVGNPTWALRRLGYKYIARGARGIGIWRDCVSAPEFCDGSGPVDQQAWWPDVPYMRNELNAMLPLIRQPHWTNWTVTYNSALPIDLGTRDYNGRGHIIVVNRTTSPVNVTFTLSGLPYQPLTAANFFTGATISSISGNTFSLTLPGVGVNSGSAVIRLDGTASPIPVITSATTASGTVGTAFSYQITATNSPTSFGATSLPPGLSVNTSTGLISGTPTTGGTFTPTLSATNADGTGQILLTVTISVPPLPDQLYVHYKFDEGGGSTAVDSGTCGCPGTLMNNPTRIGGRIGTGALAFNGLNQVVQNTSIQLPAAQPFTLQLWVNTAGGTPSGTFSFGIGEENRLAAHIAWSDNILYFDVTNWVEGRTTTDFAPYLNTWTHVTLLYDGAQSRRIYINGLPKANNTTTVPLPGARTGLNIGLYQIEQRFFAYQTGSVDDFRFYTGVRSDAQILADYLGSTKGVMHRIVRN